MSLSANPSQVVTMGDALRGIARRKILVLTTLLLGVLAGAAVLWVAKPAYQSEAQVIIENLATPYDKVTNTQDTRTEPVGDRMVLSQVSVLKSQDLVSRISNALKLAENPEFNPLLNSVGMLKKVLIATGFSDDPYLMTAQQLAIKHVSAQLTVYPVPESNVIGIKYQSGNGQTAADVANAIAESYVISTRENESGSTSRAKTWLSQQIADLRFKVAKSEADVESYRSNAGLLKGGSTSTLGEQQTAELNTQITLAEAASGEATARAEEIKSLLLSKGSVDASSDVLNSAVVQNLREQQVTAARKISELSATYLPGHPKMIAARQELQSIDSQVRKEALKVVDSLVGQSKIAAARAKSLQASLEKSKSRQSQANQSDVKLKELERNSQADRTLLESMLSRYADAGARQNLDLQPGFARIIQKASVSSVPYFPKPGPIMALTALTGLGLGLGLAFMLEVMSAAARMSTGVQENSNQHPARFALHSEMAIPPMQIVRPASRVQEKQEKDQKLAAMIDVPLALVMPGVNTVKSAHQLLDGMLGEKPTELLAAANTIAEACLQLRNQNAVKTFSFTSIGSQGMEAGMAVVATARRLAHSKLKVIAIDVSETSILSEVFHVGAGAGLSDLVLGTADFTKVICRDPQSSVHFVSYGRQTTDQAHLNMTEKLPSILKALAEIYDVVLVHAGEAAPLTVGLIKDCKVAVLMAPRNRHRDVLLAAKSLKLKGVLATLMVRVSPASEALARSA